ncbi:hypothetical protein CDEST_03279 [Colletotrichum destructivum]|uniref:Uncharacterized protein n=1 Tax=Colletotrichum destructivum TaxID=34406 RepID=A0AAX4I4I6_9PEZI|nr:hypothetical protein CDEST_03279 [Colletotrichum destructivum]
MHSHSLCTMHPNPSTARHTHVNKTSDSPLLSHPISRVNRTHSTHGRPAKRHETIAQSPKLGSTIVPCPTPPTLLGLAGLNRPVRRSMPLASFHRPKYASILTSRSVGSDAAVSFLLVPRPEHLPSVRSCFLLSTRPPLPVVSSAGVLGLPRWATFLLDGKPLPTCHRMVESIPGGSSPVNQPPPLILLELDLSFKVTPSTPDSREVRWPSSGVEPTPLVSQLDSFVRIRFCSSRNETVTDSPLYVRKPPPPPLLSSIMPLPFLAPAPATPPPPCRGRVRKPAAEEHVVNHQLSQAPLDTRKPHSIFLAFPFVTLLCYRLSEMHPPPLLFRSTFRTRFPSRFPCLEITSQKDEEGRKPRFVIETLA